MRPYLDHCRPEQPVANFEAAPKFLQDGAVWHIIILLPHDGIMEIGVEYAALARAGFHAHAAEDVHHLLIQALIRSKHTVPSSKRHRKMIVLVTLVCGQSRLCVMQSGCKQEV